MKCTYRILLYSLCLLVLILAVPIWLTWRAVRQERLNRDLIAAVKRHDTGGVFTLLEQGADANTRDEPPRRNSVWHRLLCLLQHRPPPPSTPTALQIAMSGFTAPYGFRPYSQTLHPVPLSLIRDLLEHGANPNLRDANGWTLLMWTAVTGKTDLAQLLLAHRADPNLGDAQGVTALALAACNGPLRLVQLLLSHGANPNAVCNIDLHIDLYPHMTPLLLAQYFEHVEIVRALIERGADVNVKDSEGRTPLQIAQGRRGFRSERIILHLLQQAGAKE